MKSDSPFKKLEIKYNTPRIVSNLRHVSEKCYLKVNLISRYLLYATQFKESFLKQISCETEIICIVVGIIFAILHLPKSSIGIKTTGMEQDEESDSRKMAKMK